MTAVKIKGMEYRSHPYKYGISSWKKWCEKNNCELIVLDELLHPHDVMKVNFHRYYAFDILEASNIECDKVLLTDADCIIHTDCPNFFEMTDGKYTVTHTDGCYDWTCRSLENYSHFMFNNQTFPLGKYFNASSDIRHALEINYIDEFQAKFDLNPTQNRNLINNYYNVVSFDYNYLKKLTDNIEFIGSGGIGTMTMDGAQADIGQPATGDNATFDSEDSIFMSFGAGLLINLDDDYDLKLLLKRYSDTETGLLTNNANRTDRHFGFEDSYISSISLLYNF